MSAHNDDLSAEAAAVFQEQSALVRGTTSPLVKALLGTAPFTGGVSSLLGDFAARRQEVRLRRFLIALSRDAERRDEEIRLKMDQSVLESDQFACVVESVMQEAARTADEQKLEMLRRFLIGATFRDRPDAQWQDLFLKYVQDLSGVHLVALASISGKQSDVADGDRLGGVRIPPAVPIGVRSIASELSLGPELANVVCCDLANVGLLVDWASISKSQRTTLQSEYVVSPSGIRFMRFLDGT